jgi:hypothetical protein
MALNQLEMVILFLQPGADISGMYMPMAGLKHFLKRINKKGTPQILGTMHKNESSMFLLSMQRRL